MSQPERIVGVEHGLKAVLERAQMVARSSAPVLLLGETGTGKEVIARVIHDRSTHRHGPFWRVNCGALAPDLIDSELFGHEKGAFTGATLRRKGWFEQANGGTLFLDEVGELTPAAQVRLLRVVQEGELVRLGGERAVRVDVRIIAATHRDLPAMVVDHAFREDLYYRLAVFPILIPPLRERAEDIRELAEYFADRAARRFGLRPSPVTDQDVARLTSYLWPGNIRELAAVIDRAVLIGDGQGLRISAALGAPATDTARQVPAAVSTDPTSSVVLPLDTVIRQHIELALRACRGRVDGASGAARLLEVNPHTLRGRMRKLGVEWRRYRG